MLQSFFFVSSMPLNDAFIVLNSEFVESFLYLKLPADSTE